MFHFYGEKDSDLVFKKKVRETQANACLAKIEGCPRAIYSRMQEIYDFFLFVAQNTETQGRKIQRSALSGEIQNLC